MAKKKQTEADLFQGQFIREIELRYKSEEWVKDKISDPGMAATFFRSKIGLSTQEHFVAMYLSNKNDVLGWCVVSIGSATEAMVHPADVIRPALLSGATGIIVAHNHPSGDPRPSTDDLTTTKRLQEACKLIGITLLDHLILGDTRNISLREEGMI